MAQRGTLADTTAKWKDYALYVLRHQSQLHTAILGAVLAAVAYKLLALPGAARLPGAGLALFAAVVGAYEAWEHLQRYRFAGHAHIKPLAQVEIGADTKIAPDALQPSPGQRAMGFTGRYTGANRVFCSDRLDADLLERDWSILVDQDRLGRVRRLVREHREHGLAYLTALLRDAGRNGALLVNEDKLCLADELSAQVVHCHRAGYFDSLCTNNASMVSLVEGHRISHPYTPDSTLYPVAHGVEGYYLQDLHEADLCNGIGVSTLAITADRCFVLGQQTRKNVQSPGMLICTASGSCDYADLNAASLRRTLVGAMERELAEECHARGGRGLPPSAGGLAAETRIIGFFRWLQRGGKPEFIGISRLRVDARVLAPDGFEVAGIVGQTHAGEPVRRRNQFPVPTLADLPRAIADIRHLFEGDETVQPLRPALPLRRILDVLEHLHATRPQVLHEILYGEPSAP
ncbi:MAG: hypothetical protein V4864_25010 [Pseudomonadota bacterium]